MISFQELKALAKSDIPACEKFCAELLGKREKIAVEFRGKLYRGRLFEEAVSIDNVSEISYIPNPEWVRGYGRANTIKQPIFYCAESFSTIFFESMLIRDGIPPSPRASIIFGEWLTVAPLNLIIIVQPEKSKRKGFFEIEYGKHFDRIKGTNKGIVKTMEFLHRIYFERAQENADYILPAIISNIFYQNYDGILYPSAPFTNGGYNIALKPKVKDAKLKINKIIKHTFQWESKAASEIYDNGLTVEAKSVDAASGQVIW